MGREIISKRKPAMMSLPRILLIFFMLWAGKIQAAAPASGPLESDGARSVSVLAQGAFNAWQVKVGSALTDYRYAVSSERSFDRVKASITLLNFQDGKYQPVGLLVFFDDKVGDLTKNGLGADELVGKIICLFFHYSDYESLLESLQVNKAGQVLLSSYSDNTQDGSKTGVYGQLLFNPVKNQ
jgi:hypothetical protein